VLFSFEIWKFWRGRIAGFRINSRFFCEHNRGRPRIIVHLIVQLYFGAYNFKDFLLYILNWFQIKWMHYLNSLTSWFHYPLDHEMKYAKACTRFTGTRGWTLRVGGRTLCASWCSWQPQWTQTTVRPYTDTVLSVLTYTLHKYNTNTTLDKEQSVDNLKVISTLFLVSEWNKHIHQKRQQIFLTNLKAATCYGSIK
jgi:hypothetical protein